MEKEIKKKWVNALRSGKYKQNRKSLQNEDGTAFCCLGVLCKELGWGIRSTFTNGEIMDDDVMNEEGEWKNYDPLLKIIRCEESSNLGFMNDEGKSFEEIADYIEKFL